MAPRVIPRPQPPQCVLPAHIPELEMDASSRDRRDVLPYGRDRFAGGKGEVGCCCCCCCCVVVVGGGGKGGEEGGGCCRGGGGGGGGTVKSFDGG